MAASSNEQNNHSDHGRVMNFEAFFNEWLTRQEIFNDQLLDAMTPKNVHKNEQQHQRLIDQVFSHYQQYFAEKSMAAQEDAFIFMSPPWLTPFEKMFLWVGGFRPTLIFKLVTNSINDLTPEQRRAVEKAKEGTRIEERELGESMARVQETVGSVPLMNLARRYGAGNYFEGEVSEMETAVKELQNGMLEVLKAADALRGTTVRKIVQNLQPIQTVKLLSTYSQFQLRIRRWGLDHERTAMAAAAASGFDARTCNSDNYER